MAYIQVKSLNISYTKPTFSFNRDIGKMSISRYFFEYTKITSKACGLYKSDKDGRDWCLRFSDAEELPIKFNKGTPTVKSKSICIELSRNLLSPKGKFLISLEPFIEDGLTLYPIITRNNLKP